ncbi:hypothetical protein [Nannocystis pusilla]
MIGKYQAQHKLGLMMFPSSAATADYSEERASPTPAPRSPRR